MKVIKQNKNKKHSRQKFDLRNISFTGSKENPNDTDPIQNNTTDIKYQFDNEDPITNYNSNKNNNSN